MGGLIDPPRPVQDLLAGNGSDDAGCGALLPRHVSGMGCGSLCSPHLPASDLSRFVTLTWSRPHRALQAVPVPSNGRALDETPALSGASRVAPTFAEDAAQKRENAELQVKSTELKAQAGTPEDAALLKRYEAKLELLRAALARRGGGALMTSGTFTMRSSGAGVGGK